MENLIGEFTIFDNLVSVKFLLGWLSSIEFELKLGPVENISYKLQSLFGLIIKFIEEHLFQILIILFLEFLKLTL